MTLNNNSRNYSSTIFRKLQFINMEEHFIVRKIVVSKKMFRKLAMI